MLPGVKFDRGLRRIDLARLCEWHIERLELEDGAFIVFSYRMRRRVGLKWWLRRRVALKFDGRG